MSRLVHNQAAKRGLELAKAFGLPALAPVGDLPPAWQRRAAVGAAIPGNSQQGNCTITPPSWATPTTTGVCGPGNVVQCNAVFPTSVAVGMAAAGTLTWTMNTSNFLRFQPVGMQFRGVNLAVSSTDFTSGFTATALTYLGTNYLLAGVALNLAAFGVGANQSLSVVHLPELQGNGQNLTMTVQNVDTATNLTLYAWLFGFAAR